MITRELPWETYGVTQVINGPAPAISGLSVDSRDTKPDHMFAALPGVNLHGAEFVQYAVRMGATLVLTDAAGLTQIGPDADNICILIADDPRLVLAKAASDWFQVQPETIAAVTGTNGKTSVASFTRQLWELLGQKAVNFGTAGVEGEVSAPLSHTTPEPITLHKLLAELADKGVTHAAMEASSHGLSQCRLDGVKLSVGAFTNLSRDHLDYHANMDDYFAAKASLFRRVLPENAPAVVNIMGDVGQKLATELAASRPVISIGHNNADLAIKNTRYRADGQDVMVSHMGEDHLLKLDLIGGFQAENVLVAAGIAIATGGAPEAVFKACEKLTTVRGRMQHVATRANGALVYVDYAHTPDALETALNAMRPHVMGRLLVVFGAGGDRDAGKRPLMGEAAKNFADVVFVTDDNPRSEDPARIRSQILAACPKANEVGDRALAILTAVDALKPGDALLIAGKGHETGQIVGNDILPFDDAEQASIAVSALEGLAL